jgi:hypothetical protein
MANSIIRLVQEQLEDTKGVIRIRLSKKNRKHNVTFRSTLAHSRFFVGFVLLDL